MKILETERLVLRHFVPNDLDSLYALYRDPEVRRYFPEGTLTYAETREELEWFLNGIDLSDRSRKPGFDQSGTKNRHDL